MIYLDANIFVHAVLAGDAKGKSCEEILRKVINGEIAAATSFLTWDEFLHVAKKYLGKTKALEESDKLLKMPAMTFIEVNETVMKKAQRVAEKFDLSPRDAIHAASAIIIGADKIVSDDSDFDSLKEIKRISPEDFSK